MNAENAVAFGQSWVNSWNRHDVESVLTFFSADIHFTSPVAARILPETNGIVRGKDALRVYWQSALNVIPDLHFTPEAVYQGVDTTVINYKNH